MKPIKALLPFSRWLLRICVLAWVILQNMKTLQTLDVHSQGFYISLAFIVFAILLFAGGFSSKPGLTVISAIFLTLLFIYKIYLGFAPVVTETVVVSFVFLAVSIYFMSSANK